VLHALLILPRHFLVHLLSSFKFLGVLVHFFLLPGLVLLLFYEGFDHGGLGNVLVCLVVEQIFLLFFLVLRITNLLSKFLPVGSFRHNYLLSLVLL